jgi:thiosulfate dehydrogenase [quinone] large subunit
MVTVKRGTGTDTAPAPERSAPSCRVWAIARISLGWILLWTFLDGTFAFGFPTGRAQDGTIDFFGDAAWISGGSPTGMLEMAAKGPFAEFYRDIAGTAWLDWLFMSIFLVAGVALILGIGMRIAAGIGAALLVVAWTAVSIWPVSNPFMSEYLFYALVLVGLATVNAGDTWGFGEKWGETRLVRNHPILR